jgi:serine/threonine-protein kinase
MRLEHMNRHCMDTVELASGGGNRVSVGLLAFGGQTGHIQSHLHRTNRVTVATTPLTEALRDRYVLERELGRGGMATVYLARDLRHRRYVALKTLKPELATAVGVERFQREVQLAASLQHPNILPLHDSGDTVGVLWYTMPFVDGESLRERLRREGRLDLEQALQLAREVAEALDCAHEAGIVHRDIKPENILLSRGHALVADFGIARAVHEAGETLTQTGLALGTPAYMSPEQAGGIPNAVDRRSDIYSLGCVFYEMLTGQRPFGGPTPEAMQARRMMEAAPDPRVARPEVPGWVVSIMARALAVKPEDRFATAGELAAAIRNPTTTAYSGTAGLKLARGVTGLLATRRSWIAGVVILVVLLIAGAAWFARQPPTHAELDDTLLAVAPFDILDPSLALWHEGLMDVLSRTLDGVGTLRTVSPAVITQRWGGRADHNSAAALGRATGAARVLYGAVIPAGADSVRLSATLHDERTKGALAEFDLRGSRDRIDRLADTLTVGVLRALAPPTGLSRLSGSPVGTGSTPALKAFLKGEQHYRRSEFDSAQAAFRKAVTLDSGFALAWHRLSRSNAWQDSTEDFRKDDPEIVTAAYRAAAARGLSVRDSLRLTADSLFWALSDAPDSALRFDERFWSYHTRLFSTLDEARRRYPQDPEVMLSRAEAGWQWGGAIGRPFEETLELYDRAIALDSAFTPAYPHAAFIALAMGDCPLALRYIQTHLRWSPSGSVREVLWLIRSLLSPGVDNGRAERLLDSLPTSGLNRAMSLLAMSADSGEAVVQVVRAMVRRDLLPREDWRFVLAEVLGSRGHLQEMLKLSREAPLLLARDASLLIPVISTDTLRRYRLMWYRSRTPYAENPPPILRWLATEGDTSLLRRLANLALPGSDDQMVTRAFLALAKRDTADAVARFLAIPDSSLLAWYNMRLAKAQLLRASGHLREAARTLRPTLNPWGAGYVALDGFWQLERGRTYEALGDMAAAQRGYQTVVDLWRHADPELQPYVVEARDALARRAKHSQ